MQVKTLNLHAVRFPTPASSQLLAEALCYMPNLSDLTLETDFDEEPEEFLSSLKTHASSIQGCFPQIRKGNFRLNGIAQDDLNSFLQTLSSSGDSDDLSISDGSNDSDVLSVSDGSNDSDDSDGLADLANISVTTDVHSPRRTSPPSDHPQQQPMGDVRSPRRTFPPSDHPQHQPMGDVHSSRRTIPSSDHPQHHPMGDVHSPRRTLPPSDHPQHHPMGDVHSSRRTIPPSDHPQHQPMGDVHSPRRTLPPSDHPQHHPMEDVHSSRRTIPSSDHPQQHVGNTSDAVCQFSQTHREGSSSQSRPYKRQAPSTQSKVPQDDPEIPEKQSKV
ncbi:early nodulin-75-like [Strongylocentrotus purpuratus]|uniref:Uncharacterized protein n=1 Tax=Strongylocentrotus purpuratus TaxID=7668 RepID=A0A7M7SWM4_STRPU|nr:early nodulin-75-like [Strongylocentrotus purpuratus]